MQTHVIVNAVAGGFRRHPGWVDDIRAVCADRAEVQVTKTLEELRAATRVVSEAGADMVVLCGGDGSHMAGTSALVEAYGSRQLPHLCLARGGSAGTIGHNLNRQVLAPAEQVRRALQVCRERGMIPFVRQPSLLVEDSNGGKRVGFIFGTGLIAAFFKEFYSSGGGGYREASRMIGRVLAGSFVAEDSLARCSRRCRRRSPSMGFDIRTMPLR